MPTINSINQSGIVNYIAQLQSNVAELAYDLAILANDSVYEMSDGVSINFDDTAGIDGSSSGYTHNSGLEVVTNESTTGQTGYTAPTANGGFGGYGAIQKIPASAFSADGSQVRVQLKSFAAGSAFSDVYISEQAGSGDAYDSHTDLVRLTFNDGDNDTGTLNDGDTIWSDWISYTWESDNVHLVCMKNSAGGISYLGSGSWDCYYKAAAADVGSQDRSGWTTDADGAMVVNDIEITSGAQNMSLISTAYEANSDPEEVACTLRFVQPSSDVTVGTDLKIEISRDGETTWTEMTNLSELRTSGTTTVCGGTIDVSGQPSGSTVQARITTPGGTPKIVQLVAFTLQME